MASDGPCTSRYGPNPEDGLWCVAQGDEVFARFVAWMNDICVQIGRDINGFSFGYKRK